MGCGSLLTTVAGKSCSRRKRVFFFQAEDCIRSHCVTGVQTCALPIFIWADLEKPRASKLADRRADLVLISNLLFQLSDKKAPLKEAWRILKPAGRLAVIDWEDS